MAIEAATASLITQIPLIAKEYGVRYDISQYVLTEAVRLVLRRFSFLGINELREAYRDYYSGRTAAAGAEAYGGEFSVSQLGKILNAYCKKRQNILVAYKNLKSDFENKEREKEIHQRKQDQFNKEFPVQVLLKIESIKSWSDVPVFWWNIFKKYSWISFEPGEAKIIFEEAAVIAKIELQKMENHRKTLNITERFKVQIPSSDNLQKQIAGQLTIFKKCVGNTIWINNFKQLHMK